MLNPFRKESGGSGAKDGPRTTVGDRLVQFAQGQRKLWRLNYGLLALGTVAFVAASSGALRSFAQRYEVLLLGVVIVVAVFMIYACKRNQEISELRCLVRGIEQRDPAAPSDQQLHHVLCGIGRS